MVKGSEILVHFRDSRVTPVVARAIPAVRSWFGRVGERGGEKGARRLQQVQGPTLTVKSVGGSDAAQSCVGCPAAWMTSSDARARPAEQRCHRVGIADVGVESNRTCGYLARRRLK
jgi:hypothetical protein